MSSSPTVDGEYDPVVAAANRAAASRRASQRQEAEGLRREAEARKKAAEAARIAQIKKKQAETAAKLEQVRLSAEKRRQTTEKRAQERRARAAKRAEPKPSVDKPPIKQVMKSARAVTGTITDAGLKTKEGVSSVLDNWAAHNDKLYEKGNFLSPTEKTAVLKEVQKNPFLAYDIMTGTKPEKPPKTFDEALNRMNYLVSEVALGGAREVTLPFSLGAGQPRRMEDAILQVTGGLLTPSPADLLVSTAFRKLAAQGKKGTNLLKKVLRGTTLTSDEALQFERMVGEGGYSTADLRKLGENLGPQNIDMLWNEMQGIPTTAAQARKFEKLVGQSGFSTSDLRNLSKVVQEADTSLFQKIMKGAPMTQEEALEFEKLVGQYGYSTSDLRKAGTKLNKLSQAEWDDLMRAYNRHNEFWKSNPNLYGSGAAYKPALLQEFGEILDDLGYDAGEYIDYLKANKLGPTMNPATMIAFINGVPPPKADLKAYAKIESDLEKYRESLKLKTEEITEEAVITGPATRTGLKQPDPTKPGYTPPPEVAKEKEDEVTLPGLMPPSEVAIEEEEAVVTTDTPTKVVKTKEPTTPDEPTKPDKPATPPTPVKPKKKGDPGSRPNVFRALVGGIKEAYRIVFTYPKGKSESFTVTARSFPQALSQATQLRRVKYVPSEVDISKRR